MEKATAERIGQALTLIRACEADLDRKLSFGECRDLLKDNTEWSSEFVDKIVRSIWQ